MNSGAPEATENSYIQYMKLTFLTAGNCIHVFEGAKRFSVMNLIAGNDFKLSAKFLNGLARFYGREILYSMASKHYLNNGLISKGVKMRR